MTGREVLRAIADGAEPSEFEFSRNEMFWGKLPIDLTIHECTVDSGCHFRRKPKTRVVNGFTVPAPESVALKRGHSFFLSDTTADEWCVDELLWHDDKEDCRWLSRGLVFLTKEAAIANAKAMCGIDPNKD